MTQEQKDKLSQAHKGKVFSDEHRRKLSESHKGQIPTNLEQLRELSKRPKTAEHIEKIRQAQIGKKKNISPESRLKMRLCKLGKPTWNKGNKGFMAGPKNARWIADRTKLKIREDRRDQANHYWVKLCKERDNKKCKMRNKDCKGQLEVHHILSFNKYPELRYDVNNGICLCHFHHPRKKKDVEKMIEFFKKLIS